MGKGELAAVRNLCGEQAGSMLPTQPALLAPENIFGWTEDIAAPWRMSTEALAGMGIRRAQSRPFGRGTRRRVIILCQLCRALSLHKPPLSIRSAGRTAPCAA